MAPIPVHVDAGSSGLTVEWMDMEPSEFREPFFRQTVARGRAANRQRCIAPAESLLDDGSRGSTPALDVAIFHLSRCGSTLVANAVRTSDDAIVLSEPQPLTYLLSMPLGDAEWERRRRRYMSGFIRAFRTAAGDRQRTVVVKLSSLTVPAFPIVKLVWPSVLRLLIIRHPVEVIASQIRDCGGWLSAQTGLDLGTELGKAKAVDYCLEQYCSMAMSGLALARSGALVIDYAQLTAEVLTALMERIGIAPDGEAAVERVCRRYSKSEADLPFVDDVTAKRDSVGPAQTTACLTRALPIYRELRACCATM